MRHLKTEPPHPPRIPILASTAQRAVQMHARRIHPQLQVHLRWGRSLRNRLEAIEQSKRSPLGNPCHPLSLPAKLKLLKSFARRPSKPWAETRRRTKNAPLKMVPGPLHLVGGPHRQQVGREHGTTAPRVGQVVVVRAALRSRETTSGLNVTLGKKFGIMPRL